MPPILYFISDLRRAPNLLFKMFPRTIGNPQTNWGPSNECEFMWTHNEVGCRETSQCTFVQRSTKGRCRICCSSEPSSNLLQSFSRMFWQRQRNLVCQYVRTSRLTLHWVSESYIIIFVCLMIYLFKYLNIYCLHLLSVLLYSLYIHTSFVWIYYIDCFWLFTNS